MREPSAYAHGRSAGGCRVNFGDKLSRRSDICSLGYISDAARKYSLADAIKDTLQAIRSTPGSHERDYTEDELVALIAKRGVAQQVCTPWVLAAGSLTCSSLPQAARRAAQLLLQGDRLRQVLCPNAAQESPPPAFPEGGEGLSPSEPGTRNS